MRQLLTILFFTFSITVQSYCQNRKAIIKNIYPTTDSIPENILRFYIEFSAPIREENALSHIHLTGEDEKELSIVFFDNNYELWNADRTMLTLILDPGRLKTGLKANKELGRVFQKGLKYSMTVDSLFTIMKGNHLSKGFVKHFVASEADTLAPDSNKWLIHTPPSSTISPLVIDFGETIDHVSALGYLAIIDNEGNRIEGTIILRSCESVWEFVPKKQWRKGGYTLFINSRFEDIAANNLNGLFDHSKGGLKNYREGEIKTITITIK
jgi:hypothetical protein